MYGSLARRAALAVSALAALVAVVCGPSTASANSLFQGAVASPSPSPTPGALPPEASWPGSMAPTSTSSGATQPPGASWPGSMAPTSSSSGATQPPGAAWPGGGQPQAFPSGGIQPPAAPSLTPPPAPQPDIKVTSLGIVHGAGGGDAYSFQVKNVGKGSASELKITRQAVVKRKGEKSWVRTAVSSYVHAGGLRPGQEIVVEVVCPATDKQYCDLGGVLADVVGTPEDADPSNNHMTEFENIKG